jgi:hypothetical protein
MDSSVVADIIVALSALGTVITAIIGLNTWKTEYLGTRKAELQFRVRSAIVALRDAVEAGRYPAMIYPPLENPPDEPSGILRLREIQGWANRQERVATPLQDLEALASQVEIQWGLESRKTIDEFIRHCRWWWSSVNVYCASLRSDGNRPSGIDKLVNVIFQSEDDLNGNGYGAKLSEYAERAMEAVL